MKPTTVYKILIGLIIILAPWLISKSIYETPLPAQEIVNESVGFYQTNTCRYSLGEVFKENVVNEKIEILPDLSSKIECFGKVNGVDVVGEKIKVYVGTNPNIDFILQSIFWLLIISFIPRGKIYIKKFPDSFAIFTMIGLLLLHLRGEEKFYLSFFKNFDISISFDNYVLLSFLILIILILQIFADLMATRFYNLINYFPFIFLLAGTYNSLNINFFLLIISFIGLIGLQEGYFLKIFTFSYFFISIIHLTTFKISNVYFDVDKLKGFINSSQNYSSLIFWILIIYLFVNGLMYIFKTSKNNINLAKIKINFLLSGGFIVIVGIISSVYNYINYLAYYYLGLNKLGIKSFNSIEGNTWRGISPSAEAAGEFFALAVLFWIIASHFEYTKITSLEIFLLVINLYGLYRSNNFAATLSLILILIAYFLNVSKVSSRSKNITYLISLFLLIIIVNTSNEYSYDFTSKTLLHQGVSASIISSDFPGNEYGLNAAENSNFGQILLVSDSEINLSSSLKYTLKEFTENGNIKFLPDKIALWSVISVPINRSEKWGIFLAKYNPNLNEALFGYGPQQLANYYLGHPTKFNDGLVLPHSSLLDILIFYGLVGVAIILLFISIFTIKNVGNSIFIYPWIFILINYLKSDSLLYLSSFTLALFIINLYDYEPAIDYE